MIDDLRGRDRLEAGIAALRSEVPVRPEWRERLLREVASLPAPLPAAHSQPVVAPRRLVLAPAMALAAALAFMVFGAAATYVVMSARAPGAARQVAAAGERPGPIETSPESPLVTVRFMLVAPAAQRVSLVGDFNQWSAGSTPMRRARDGQSWVIEVGLRPGRHAYAFVVDDDVVADPAAPSAVGEDFGVPSSVVLVAENGR